MKRAFALMLVVVLWATGSALAVNMDSLSITSYWHTSTDEDPMSGEKSCYAITDGVGALKPMSFPYDNVQAWLGVGYNGVDHWVFVGFTAGPILRNDETRDGYSAARTRVKWDDEIVNTTLLQEWGSSFLQFQDGRGAVSRIERSDTMLLELDWYSEGKVYFQFPLAGAAEALAGIRAECGAP